MILERRLLAAATLLILCRCATVNPEGAFVSTREVLAGRHPGTVTWLRDDGARALADERRQVLLAAPLTLDGAVEVALLGNPALQARLWELGIAQADLAQATRLSNPGLSFTRLSGEGRQTTVALTGDVVDWLTLPLRRRVAAAELERTKLEIADALLDLVAEARLALLRYRAASALGERLAQIEEIDRAAADYAQALFDAGNLTALERANAQAAWGETRGELGRARLEVQRAGEAVRRVLGLAGDQTWSTTAEVPEPDAPQVDIAAWEGQAVAARLDLKAADWAVTVLEHALTLKRGTRFSPLGIELGVERERETDGARLTGPTVELRLPLFDTGKASIARLESELARAHWQRRALEQTIRSEVREQVADLEAAAALHALYRDTVLPLRAEVLQRTLAEYNQMLIGTFDVLLAKGQAVAAERRAIEALEAWWQARIALDRSTGGGLPLGTSEPASTEPEPQPEDPHRHHHHHHGGTHP